MFECRGNIIKYAGMKCCNKQNQSLVLTESDTGTMQALKRESVDSCLCACAVRLRLRSGNFYCEINGNFNETEYDTWMKNYANRGVLSPDVENQYG